MLLKEKKIGLPRLIEALCTDYLDFFSQMYLKTDLKS